MASEGGIGEERCSRGVRPQKENPRLGRQDGGGKLGGGWVLCLTRLPYFSIHRPLPLRPDGYQGTKLAPAEENIIR
jgi:hypothetical protein